MVRRGCAMTRGAVMALALARRMESRKWLADLCDLFSQGSEQDLVRLDEV